MENDTIVAFSHSKHRNQFGMVGIEIEDKIAYVRLAKQWKREDINKIPNDVKNIYKKIQWTDTFADQLIGVSLIRNIEHAVEFVMHTITTQKNMKNPEDIEKIKVMDQIEMTQLLLSLKQDHKIQFPQNPTPAMTELISQFEMFTEHKTESGNMSYFAPGEELDDLTRALQICCFAARHKLQHGEMDMIIQTGVDTVKPRSYEEEIMGELFMDSPSSQKITTHLDTYYAYKNKRY